jgi:arsenate reductase
MAEAIVNARYPEWRAFSAGARPVGFVHPMAVQVLREIGIAHEGESKSVGRFRAESFGLVITLWDTAGEECPAWLGRGRRLHASLADPTSTVGSDQDKLAAFRQVRDDMVLRIPDLLKKPSRP